MYIYGRIVYRQIIVIGTHTQTPTYTVCWLISNAQPSHRNCHFGIPASQIWRLCIDVWSEVSGPQIRQSWAFKCLFELCFYFLHVWISLHRGLLPQMHVVIVYIYIIHDIFYTVTCYNIHAYMLHTLRSPKTWNHYKPLIDLPRVDIIVYPVEELSVSPLEQLHPMNWSLPATVDLNALMMEVKQQNSHMDMGSKWQEFSCGKANHKARTKWPFPVKLGWFVIGLTPLVGSSTNS